MRILLINHYAGSPEMGMEFRPYYLAREWVRAGHEVTIVAGSFSQVRSKQPVFKGKYHEEIIDKINYFWIKTPAFQGNGLGRIRNILTFLFRLRQKAFYISKKFNPEIVIASSTYPMDIYPARKIARLTRARLVYEVHDLWPLSPMELGGYSKNHPFIRIVQRAEDFAYKHSDHIISMLPKTLDYMKSRGLNPDKWNYVPNGVVPEEWNEDYQLPEPHEKLFKEIKEKKHLIVGYTGSFGLSNSVHTFIEAAGFLQNEDISFVLVGKGPEKEKLLQLAKEKQINNVYFLNAVPKTGIPCVLSFMDILFIGLQKQSLFRFGISPNKMFDYMMAAKPVVQAIEAGNNMAEEAKCGIFVEPENPKAIADAIIKMRNLPFEEKLKLGENGKKYVLENHDYRILAKNFIDFIS